MVFWPEKTPQPAQKCWFEGEGKGAVSCRYSMYLVPVRQNNKKTQENKGFFVIVPKKVYQKAVARNRAKRRVSEVARLLGVKSGKVRVVKSIDALTYHDITNILKGIFIEKKGFLE